SWSACPATNARAHSAARTRSIGSPRSATSRGTARRAGRPERAAPAGSSSTRTQSRPSASLRALDEDVARDRVAVAPAPEEQPADVLQVIERFLVARVVE